MSLRALTTSGVGIALAGALAFACGGKVGGASSSGASGTPTDPAPQLPPSGVRPGRPPGEPATPASVASQLAEMYCKAFSSCCVGTGQPPIDVSRCRQLVAAEVESRVSEAADLEPEAIATCLGTIKGRVMACGQVDAAWWSSSFPLLAPASVAKACASVFGLLETTPSAGVCTSDASCAKGFSCAIDQCVDATCIGTTCGATSDCVDGPLCIGSVCTAPPDVMINGACFVGSDCRLGLVCAKGLCLPSRDFPELATPRFSPYRIGADTCRAYAYL